MICQICHKSFVDTSMSTHLKRTHHANVEQYYLTYIGNKGQCLTCGKPTTFISLTKGYHRFCSNKCVGSNKDIQKQKEQTTKKHFGVAYPSQSKAVQKTKVKTLQSRYGCDNAFNISHIKEKAQKNSHTVEANTKRGAAVSKTKSQQFKNTKYKQSVIDKMINTNQSKYGVDWTSNLDSTRHKISESVKKNHPRNLHKYKFNNLQFDSSYELAYYIYYLDKGQILNRKPCKIYYWVDGKRHTYTPDFQHKNQLIEIKGKWFFNANGELYNPFNKQLAKEKFQCMIDNHVKIITDVSKYTTYCSNKYNDTHWYRQFRK